MKFVRHIAPRLEESFKHSYVHILFGARQTGKTTLLRELLDPDLDYNLADPEERGRLLAQPGLFRRECEAATG